MDKVLSKTEYEKYIATIKKALNDSEQFAIAGKDAMASFHKTFKTPFSMLSNLLGSDFFYYFVVLVIWIVILQIAWKFAIRQIYSTLIRSICCFFRQGIRNFDTRYY
jgi:hypothetical protein